MEELGELPFVESARKKRSISTPPSILGMSLTSSRSQRSRSLSAPELNVVSVCTEQSIPRHLPKLQRRDRYRYTALRDREIRRLRLIGSHNRNEPLRGVIETVPFSTYSPYTAVSYVWGDNTQPFQLLIGEDQYVPLTASLNCLLRDFRECISETRKHAGRWVVVIWVDQLCLYANRYQRKYCGNLRFGPLYPEEFHSRI